MFAEKGGGKMVAINLSKKTITNMRHSFGEGHNFEKAKIAKLCTLRKDQWVWVNLFKKMRPPYHLPLINIFSLFKLCIIVFDVNLVTSKIIYIYYKSSTIFSVNNTITLSGI